MQLKSIAVFIEPTEAGKRRVAFAADLAARHEAHLIGIFAMRDDDDVLSKGSFVRGEAAIRDLIQRLRAEEADVIETAATQFADATGGSLPGFEFRVIAAEDVGEQLILSTLHVDLVVVGNGETGGGLPEDWSAEEALLASGVPFLIVPDEWRPKLPGGPFGRIVIGWNATREARRAVADALPLLKRTSFVWILVVDAEENGRHGEEPGADIAHHLSRHGVEVMVVQLGSNRSSVAEVVLDFASSVEADLVVIGAFSRSRMVEAVFGGVTRHLVDHAPVPLLIAN